VGVHFSLEEFLCFVELEQENVFEEDNGGFYFVEDVEEKFVLVGDFTFFFEVHDELVVEEVNGFFHLAQRVIILSHIALQEVFQPFSIFCEYQRKNQLKLI